MAKMSVTFGRVGPGHPSFRAASLVSETLDFSVEGQVSTLASTPDTGHVRVASDVDCWVEIGLAPTAVIGEGLFLPAQSVEAFEMPVGYKIAVIGAS